MTEQRTKFTCLLPSNLAGANFRAVITAQWKPTTDQDVTTIGAVVRHTLYHAAIAQTKAFTVSEVDAACDAVIIAIGGFEAPTGKGENLAAGTASAKLKVDKKSRRIEAEFQQGRRQQQLQLARQELRLTGTLNTIFKDSALARIWWMHQPPEIVNAIDSGFFDKTLEAAQESLAAGRHEAEDYIHLLAELAQWLHSDDSRTGMVLGLIDRLLGANNLDEMQNRFRRIARANQEKTATNGGFDDVNSDQR